jgi:hypothetical protein
MNMTRRMRRGRAVEHQKSMSPTHLKEALRLAKRFSNPSGISTLSSQESIKNRIAESDENIESFDLATRLNPWFSNEQTVKMVDLTRKGELRQERFAKALGMPVRTFRYKVKKLRDHKNN